MSQSNVPLLLAFGAHPDDIEFGCGGVIASETQAGRAAHFVICSRGEAATNGTPEQRAQEAEKGAAILGATVEFLKFGGDAHLEVKLEHTLILAAIIRRLRPQIILAPTVVENQHPDHFRVGHMVRDAARLARFGGIAELKSDPAHAIGQLLFYAVTAEGEPTAGPELWIDVSDPVILDTWRASMDAHATQAKTQKYTELQLARAHVLGLRAGLSHAIALYPCDPLVFNSVFALGRGARQF